MVHDRKEANSVSMPLKEYASAAFLVLAFVILLRIFGLFKNSLEVVAISRAAIVDMRNPFIDDLQKERLMQASSKSLGVLFIQLVLGFFAAVIIPLGVIWILDIAGLVAVEDVMAVTTRWEFMLGGLILAVVAFVLPGRA